MIHSFNTILLGRQPHLVVKVLCIRDWLHPHLQNRFCDIHTFLNFSNYINELDKADEITAIIENENIWQANYAYANYYSLTEQWVVGDIVVLFKYRCFWTVYTKETDGLG